jgi:hypothetical protein
VGDLEKRLAEALKREAASSEILRVISRSPSELQPVLDAVTERAARLCEALDASILLRDGDWVQSQEGVGSTFTFTIPVRREP